MKQTSEYTIAMEENADRYVPACGGQEVAFKKNGTRWLYVYNPFRKQHGYLNLETDIVEFSIDFSK